MSKIALIATNIIHLFSLKVYVIWNKIIDRYLLSTVFLPLDIFCKTKNYCVQINALSTFSNEGGPL